MARFNHLDPLARRAVAIARDHQTFERTRPRSSTALAIAPPALPAPTTMVRPRGWGGRCEAKHFEGKARRPLHQNMLRSSERGSIAITICTSR